MENKNTFPFDDAVADARRGGIVQWVVTDQPVKGKDDPTIVGVASICGYTDNMRARLQLASTLPTPFRVATCDNPKQEDVIAAGTMEGGWWQHGVDKTHPLRVVQELLNQPDAVMQVRDDHSNDWVTLWTL